MRSAQLPKAWPTSRPRSENVEATTLLAPQDFDANSFRRHHASCGVRHERQAHALRDEMRQAVTVDNNFLQRHVVFLRALSGIATIPFIAESLDHRCTGQSRSRWPE